jgi:hypothetical protein
MNCIDNTTLIKQKSGIIASDMDGETVMMNIDTGKYYNLGSTGGTIWTLIEKPTQFKEIINQLLEINNVERVQCEKDVLPFLEQLLTSNLIEIE